MNRIIRVLCRSPIGPTSILLRHKHMGKYSIIEKGSLSPSFAKLDDARDLKRRQISEKSLLEFDSEQYWKNKLMFIYEFQKAPKHLTWTELGKEVECLECSIDADKNRPEEIYHISFNFRNLDTGERSMIFEASNNVAEGEGLCDLLAAIGACLTRQKVHRTVRFDAGRGKYREINLRKSSKYTSEIMLGFRPDKNFPKVLARPMRGRRHPLPKKEQLKYQATGVFSFINQAKRRQETTKVEKKPPIHIKTPQEIAGEKQSNWGYHSRLLDEEFQTQDPPGTYHLTISAHAFGCIIMRAIERLIQRPLKSLYRPSQIAQSCKVEENESLGLVHAIYGWLGFEDKILPHYTPIEAIQSNWIGADAPFSLTSIICKIRELCHLTKKNPENVSWMSVRYKDTSVALRNITAKLNGMGSSKLFWPNSYNSSVNLMLPKEQRKKLRTRVSIVGLLGLHDQTSKLSQHDALSQPQDTGPSKNLIE